MDEILNYSCLKCNNSEVLMVKDIAILIYICISKSIIYLVEYMQNRHYCEWDTVMNTCVQRITVTTEH